MAVKEIDEKKIGDITYELKHFEDDNKWVIFRLDGKKIYKDEKTIKDAQAIQIKTEAVFDNEKDARHYLENLKK